jgi:uncharacterized protein (DUF1501 family)
MMSKRSVSRRAFLGASASLSLGAFHASAAPGRAKSCIVLFLVGGPSQLETWDPKPDAPAEVRGPFRPIATSVPGTRISEHLPRMATLAHRFAIVRSVCHDAPPIHEAGLQLLQTGRRAPNDIELPHFGAVLARRLGPKRTGAAPFVILPAPIGNMGINLSRGQGAGFLGAEFEPQFHARFTHLLSQADRERYGKTAFGAACAHSAQLVEQGARCVVVNMFDTVYDCVTWDCHADRHSFASTLEDYRRIMCPTFDRACATLIEDLHQRGLLDETLVVLMGEFGRTPRLNAQGGRDHWPGCWSIVLAGGGVRGGVLVGASGRHAVEPSQRPVTCGEVVASIYQAMGLPPATPMAHPDRRTLPLVDAAPLRELSC